VQAMAYYRLGNFKAADESLNTARELIEEQQPPHADRPFHYCDWAEIQVLLREAEFLLKKSATDSSGK
jgi:hypothetical protein